ncbi:7286_t:CDS:2, partial [Paraglomus occultum]
MKKRSRSLYLEKETNHSTTKRLKPKDPKIEALQELYQLHPNINGRSVWFFPTLTKSAEAWIKTLSGKRFFKGKKSALATIFLEPSCKGPSVGQIIRGNSYTSYFKNAEVISLFNIKNTLSMMIRNDTEFMGITLTEGDSYLHLTLPGTNGQKELCIKQASHASDERIKCFMFVNGYEVRDNFLKESGVKSHKISTIKDILSIVQFFKKLHVCVGQCTKGFKQTSHLRGDHLYSNVLGPTNDHEIIANLENKGVDNEAYRAVDCILLVREGNVIKFQKELTENLRNRLKMKIEAEEEYASELLISMVHSVVDEVLDKKHEN